MSIVSEKPKVVILLTPDMRSKLIPASAEKRLAHWRFRTCRVGALAIRFRR